VPTHDVGKIASECLRVARIRPGDFAHPVPFSAFGSRLHVRQDEFSPNRFGIPKSLGL